MEGLGEGKGERGRGRKEGKLGDSALVVGRIYAPGCHAYQEFKRSTASWLSSAGITERILS